MWDDVDGWVRAGKLRGVSTEGGGWKVEGDGGVL